MWGQLSTTCSNAIEVAQCWAPVAVDHSQLRTTTQSSIPWAPRIARWICRLQITRHAAASEARTRDFRHTRPAHCLCCHSGYNFLDTLTWRNDLHAKNESHRCNSIGLVTIVKLPYHHYTTGRVNNIIVMKFSKR